MLKIHFSEEEITQLFKERYSHPHPRVQRRLEALYLKSQEISHTEIRKIVKVSTRALVQWIRTYQAGGIEALKIVEWKGSTSPIREYRGLLEEYFKKHPPISVKEACNKIKELTGIERSESAIREFLKSLGMSFRKTGNVPGKANLIQQEEFKKKDSSLCCKKPKKTNDKYSLSMQPILSGKGLWAFCGV